VPSKIYGEAKLGLKTLKRGDHEVVRLIYPGSPAELANLSVGDEIIAVNNISCKNDLDKWLSYFKDDEKIVTVIRNGQVLELMFPEVMRNFYMTYSVAKIDKPTKVQQRTFDNWKK
jgi:predicted metalloprotease with PDZ domain